MNNLYVCEACIKGSMPGSMAVRCIAIFVRIVEATYKKGVAYGMRSINERAANRLWIPTDRDCVFRLIGATESPLWGYYDYICV